MNTRKQDTGRGNTFLNNLGKFAGAGLGWGLGGPIGAIIGVAIGSFIDNLAAVPDSGGKTMRGDFTMSLLVLVAAIMKADGKVLKSELDYVKQFLVRNFGREGATEALGVLKDILKQDIDVTPVCHQIRGNMDYASRLQLVYFLVNVAGIDHEFHPGEERLLEHIVSQMGIGAADRESIRSMFAGAGGSCSSHARQSHHSSTLEQAYRILEVDRDADVAAVKKAYRTMAVKYHPDKVAYLGDDVKKSAHEKFQKLNEAYELIKQDKGFN